jgi:cytochrome b subunit of formate dehydrogenase
MKEKIKDTFLVVLYLIVAFIVTSLWLSLTEGDLSNTTIGEITQTIGAIGGLCIFGLFAFVFIYIIYFGIKSYFKRKVQEEIQKTLAKEKYEQYLSEQKKKGIDKNE